jgi:hypothetical protein
MGVGKSQEENIKVLMEYKVFGIYDKKMIFLKHNSCPRSLEGSKVNCVCSLISFRYTKGIMSFAIKKSMTRCFK